MPFDGSNWPIKGYRNREAKARATPGYQRSSPRHAVSAIPRVPRRVSPKVSLPTHVALGVLQTHPATRALLLAYRIWRIKSELEPWATLGFTGEGDGDYLAGMIPVNWCTGGPQLGRNLVGSPWNCLGLQAMGGAPGSAYSASERAFGTNTLRPHILGRFQSKVTYRPMFSSAEMPLYPHAWPQPLPRLWPKPRVNPMLDPLSAPLLAPTPLPQPLPWKLLPYRRLNPWRAEQTVTGPKPREEVEPWTLPTNHPGYQAEPVVEIDYQAMPDGTVNATAVLPEAMVLTDSGWAPTRPQHQLAPPQRGHKERKVVLNAARTLPGLIFGAVTEFGDAIDAVWDALPDKFRKREQAKRHGKRPLLQVKVWQVFTHAKDIDVEKALVNLAQNQLEDKAIGYASRKANE